MKSFREKHPGLTEEQLKIKYKIWEREKEREREINEAEQKKDIVIPLRRMMRAMRDLYMPEV